MPNDFTNFIRRIKLRADNLPREVGKVVRLAALAIDQTIVMATPVDTGRARSNWLVSLSTPREDMIEAYAPIPKMVSTPGSRLRERANAQAALNQGQAQIAARQPGEAIFISNNLPYIQRLNDGYSAQAPAAFVAASIDAAVAAVAGAKIDTGG
jgi:hypothetical protein